MIFPEKVKNALIINGKVYKLVDDPVDDAEFRPCYGCELHAECLCAIGVLCVNVFGGEASGRHFESIDLSKHFY